MARQMNWLDVVALVLVVVGALNWGLVGAFDYNLVAEIFGAGSVIERSIYVLVGLAGLYTIWPTIKAGQEAAVGRMRPSRPA